MKNWKKIMAGLCAAAMVRENNVTWSSSSGMGSRGDYRRSSR